jgi:hypothetical protein
MSVLRGTINCKSDERIPPNASLKLQVVFIVDSELKRVKLVGRLDHIQTQFPIPFEIDYSDEAPPSPTSTSSLKLNEAVSSSSAATTTTTTTSATAGGGGFHFLRATIEADGHVLFRNYSAVDAGYYGDLIGRGGKFRRYLDVFLNHVPNNSSSTGRSSSASPPPELMAASARASNAGAHRHSLINNVRA